MSAKHNFSARQIMDANIRGIQRGLNIVFDELQTDIRKRLNQPGTGSGYVGGQKGQGLFRRRSAPGQPPAVDTGILRNSVQTDSKKISGTGMVSVVMAGLVAGVHKDARIPRWLEYGTPNGRMKPRPFIAPSLAAIRPNVAKTIGDQMQIAIKRMQNQAMRDAK